MPELAAIIWADGPTSTPTEPSKPEIREWGTWVETLLGSFGANGGLIYASQALLFADLIHAANSSAWVIGDPTTALNGIYQKIGMSGSGSWTRIADLPYSFIVANDVGAGTPNAIQATTTIPVTASALVWLTLAQTNTASPVTVQFNGDGALTIKTNSGLDPVVGGLPAGMTVLGIKSGSTFRLLSDQASSAIAAAAAASALSASHYADFARNNWVACGPYTGTGAIANYLLTVDPGSANNMFPIVGGVAQLITAADYSLVYVSGTPYIRINVPVGVVFEVRISNAVTVNTPADGSVTAAKIAASSVDNSKLNGVTTSAVAEGSNLYFTAARVLAAVLTGLSTATNAVITSTDTVLSALGKLQKQITDLGTGLGAYALLASPAFSGTPSMPNLKVSVNAQFGVANNGSFIAGHDTFQVSYAAGSGGGVLQHLGATGGGAPVALDMINLAGTRSGYIAISATATTFATSSDYRLKTVRGSYSDSGSVLDAIKIYDYTWNETGEDGVGAIAHELQAVFPHAVGGEKDETNEDGVALYQGVDYSKLIPVLIAEIQSLRIRVATIEASK